MAEDGGKNEIKIERQRGRKWKNTKSQQNI